MVSSENPPKTKVAFETARDMYDQMKPGWKGNKEYLLAQLFGLVEQVIRSDRIVITPPLFKTDDVRRRIIITLSMTKVVQHIWEAIRFENTESLESVFDSEHPIRCAGDVRPWYTGKPCEVTRRPHVSHCVYDSTWEATEAFELERNEQVAAWVKNDHLGYEIMYVYKAVVKKYRPDFLIRLATGRMLVLDAVTDIRAITAYARRYARKYGVRLLVLDYLGLCDIAGRYDRHDLRLAAMSKVLKALAVEAGIAVVCLSQLSRAHDKENRVPRLSDLRDSGSLEQDADNVILIERKKELPGPIAKTVLHVAKQRQGDTGTVRVGYRRPTMEYVQLTTEPEPRSVTGTEDGE